MVKLVSNLQNPENAPDIVDPWYTYVQFTILWRNIRLFITSVHYRLVCSGIQVKIHVHVLGEKYDKMHLPSGVHQRRCNVIGLRCVPHYENTPIQI